jgi:hypothetical protein
MVNKETSASDAARDLGKLGAGKGGRARANVLTQEERQDIARQAVRARWAKAGKLKTVREDTQDEQSPTRRPATTEPEMPYSLFRGDLQIADVTFECHVLSDRRRVLTQREVVRALSGGRVSGNLTRYLERNPLYQPDMLHGRTVQFCVPGGVQQLATGYDAELLVEICELYLDARTQKLLQPTQQRLADMAETVVRACAKVGIIALVDEATGYQQVREKRALQLKLEAFIAEDLQEWARMFPEEFWYQLARLEGVRYSPRSRPLRWGKYVMAFVYDSIDPDVGKELRKINPNPHHRKNHHQWLKEFGREKVNNQIQQVIAIMKLCDDMDEFKRKFDKVFQRDGTQLGLFDV